MQFDAMNFPVRPVLDEIDEFAALAKTGYGGMVTLEVFDSDRRHLAASRETFKALMETARA